MPADEPVHDVEDLLGIVSIDLKVPFDPREVIGRVVEDGVEHQVERVTDPDRMAAIQALLAADDIRRAYLGED